MNNYPTEATHLLACRHCRSNQGGGCRDYTMPCRILKDMGDGRYKVQVWGDLYWPRYGTSRIRYVEDYRVKKLNL